MEMMESILCGAVLAMMLCMEALAGIRCMVSSVMTF